MNEIYDGLIERTVKGQESDAVLAEAAYNEIMQQFKGAVSKGTLPLKFELSFEKLENKIAVGYIRWVCNRVLAEITGDERVNVSACVNGGKMLIIQLSMRKKADIAHFVRFVNELPLF